MISYKLPESTVIIDGHVDLIRDTRLPNDPRTYLGDPTATASMSVRADSSHGDRTLDPPKRGDSSLTVQLSEDERLTSVAFNSVGVASKVVAAGVKTIAVVVGTAARIAENAAMLGTVTALTAPDTATDGSAAIPNTDPPDEDVVRASWEAANEGAVHHQDAYQAIIDDCTAKLLAARKGMSEAQDAWEMTKIARRVAYLSDLLAEAKGEGEVAKVNGLYEAWSTATKKKYPQHVTFVFSIDELPVHNDPTSYLPTVDPASLPTDGSSVLRHIWDTLSVFVEIGPVSPQTAYQPNADGYVRGALNERAATWRTPRPARLWVWRRDAADDSAGNRTLGSAPILEQMTDLMVTDRFSKGNSLELEGRFFGEQAAALTINDLGVPTTYTTDDKSAVGAIADAIAAAPEQFSSGLDAISKASTSVGDLYSAGAELRLKAIKRQVDQRTQELELQGINATAEDFADLKRLQQRVAIATAQGSLATPSELDKLQADLARETAQRDLDAVRRDRAQATELDVVRNEIEQLKAEVELQKLREQRGQL